MLNHLNNADIANLLLPKRQIDNLLYLRFAAEENNITVESYK